MRKWKVAFAVVVSGLFVPQAVMADGVELSRDKLIEVRKERRKEVKGWRAEYIRLARKTGTPVRAFKYRNGNGQKRTYSQQVQREAKVHAWQRRTYAQQHKALQARSKFMETDKYLYEVLRTKDVRAMVEVAFDHGNVSSWGRTCIRAVISNESGWDPSAKNPTSTASGLLQFLDHWGSKSERFDPVWSINRVIRYWNEVGSLRGPWAATAPSGC